jgi:plastocyanin domain-containing protein
VNVTDNGFEPAEVRIRAGRSVALIMTRKTDQTCATEVEFASLHRKYALPLNQPVRITLPASPAGTLSYECGMHMVGGRILVR